MVRDNPLHRIEIREMSVEELDLFIETIRENRLAPLRIYKEAQELRKRLQDDRLIAKLDKHIKMMGKEVEAYDKAVGKLEKRVLNIKAIKLELEDAGGGIGACLTVTNKGEEDETSGYVEPVS